DNPVAVNMKRRVCAIRGRGDIGRSAALRALGAWQGTALAGAVSMLAIQSCTVLSKTIATGGEVSLKKVAPAKLPDKHVIVFALDGVGYGQFMTLVRSGKAP